MDSANSHRTGGDALWPDFTEIRTTDGWRCSDVHSMPPGMLSADRLLRPLIGCRPMMGGSAEQTSYIRQDPRARQSVAAAPVTGHLFVLDGSTFETPRELFSPLRSGQKSGDTDRINGTVFQV